MENQLRLMRRCAQWKSKTEIDHVPRGIRGIYTLLKHCPRLKKFDVVYIGMAEGKLGIMDRLRSHAKSKSKGDLWTHFSMFEVWPNISEIAEIEGLFREIYRKDRRVNKLNRQRKCKMLQRVRIRTLKNWAA